MMVQTESWSWPRTRRQVWATGLLATLCLSGCQSGQKSRDAGQPERHFVRGEVVSVNAAQGTVLLAHEAIPGFMPAMTMDYKVADPAALGEMHPGDRIAADLLNDRDAAGPRNLRLTGVDVLQQAKADYKPAVSFHVPAPGDAVPNFAFLNQSGKEIDLHQFRGKVVLMTFIYTRCPLADFCPRMSRNFADIDKQLRKNPALYAKTHLLTVSFDPAYDKPAVLRSYGGAYTGQYTREKFEHWDFAAPSEAELPKVERWFDEGVTATGQQLQHSLATTVIDPQGKVVAFYPTKDWKVEDVLQVIQKAAS